ncbi:ribosome maturation factor RimP [bacterium]|nr:ribosome maturation factor RimP [bacterium]
MEKVNLNKITSFVQTICSNSGFELVDIEHSNPSNSLKLVIFIDKNGGVSLDDCVDFNQMINDSGELDNLINSSYTLEVSSPGPKRPLKILSDYVRFKGKKAKIKLISLDKESSKKVFVGIIEDVIESKIIINDSGKMFHINFDNILKANLSL